MKPNTDTVANGNVGSPGGNTSSSGQNELIQKIAGHCGVPADIAKQALEHCKGNPQEAVNLINSQYKKKE